MTDVPESHPALFRPGTSQTRSLAGKEKALDHRGPLLTSRNLELDACLRYREQNTLPQPRHTIYRVENKAPKMASASPSDTSLRFPSTVSPNL